MLCVRDYPVLLGAHTTAPGSCNISSEVANLAFSVLGFCFRFAGPFSHCCLAGHGDAKRTNLDFLFVCNTDHAKGPEISKARFSYTCKNSHTDSLLLWTAWFMCFLPTIPNGKQCVGHWRRRSALHAWPVLSNDNQTNSLLHKCHFYLFIYRIYNPPFFPQWGSQGGLCWSSLMKPVTC